MTELADQFVSLYGEKCPAREVWRQLADKPEERDRFTSFLIEAEYFASPKVSLEGLLKAINVEIGDQDLAIGDISSDEASEALAQCMIKNAGSTLPDCVCREQKESGYTDYQLEYERPYGMPLKVFWEKTSTDADVRRAQWVMENHPDVDVEELKKKFSLHQNVIDQAKKLISQPRSKQNE